MLGKGDEAHGGHHAAGGVGPSHQGLGADGLAGAQVDLGLQEDAQLVGVDRLAQLAQQGQGLFTGRVQARVVDDHAGLLAFGHVHGDFGAAEQQVGVVAMIGGAGHADARAQVHGVVVEGEGRLERAQDALGERDRLVGAGVGQQHGEFVAAQAGEFCAGVALNLGAQAPGHGLQQAVAKAVAQHVVDVLEAVHVQHQHGAGVARRQRRLQVQAKLHAVGQGGEGVFVGQAADLAFAGLDGLAHGLERLRQLADLAAVAGVHGVAIVALFEAPRRVGQAAQGRGDALGRVEPPDGKDDDAQAGEDEQGELQALVGRQGLIDRAHQHGGDRRLAGGGVEHHGAGAVLVAGQLHRAREGCGAAGAGLPGLLQRGPLGTRQGGQGDLGARRWAGAQQGHFQAREAADVLQLGLVHPKAHAHPADEHRRAHGHGHDLEGLAADDLDLARLAGAGEGLIGLALDGGEEAIGLAGGAGLQDKVRVGEQGQVGVDAFAVVEQRRVHGLAVAAGHR